MTDALDLGAIRAQAVSAANDGEYWARQIPALCDEVERLQRYNIAYAESLVEAGGRADRYDTALGEIAGTPCHECEASDIARNALSQEKG